MDLILSKRFINLLTPQPAHFLVILDNKQKCKQEIIIKPTLFENTIKKSDGHNTLD